MGNVIALAVSDIHLSHTPPRARSAEPDWYQAQDRYLSRLGALAEELKVPVLCAGDVFHKYNPPPELINWAIDKLPPMIAVPGQHDMEHHQIGNLRKSAYWTLVKAGVITHIWPGEMVVTENNVGVVGFPWGTEPASLDKVRDNRARKVDHTVALIHKYVWSTDGTKYDNAPVEARVTKLCRQMRGFDFIVSGDNHISFCDFEADVQTPTAVNCGCLIPRRAEERCAPNVVWELKDNGSVSQVPLDGSEDKWIDNEIGQSSVVLDRSKLDTMLKLLKDDNNSVAASFEDRVKHALSSSDISESVRGLLIEAIEESQNG